MPLITIILVIVAVGVCLWLINKYVPMDGKIKKILNVVVVVALVIWLLHLVGLWDYLGRVNV